MLLHRETAPLCCFHDNHWGDGRISRWCPTPRGVFAELAAADPDRFFEPTPSKSGTFSDWIGLFLDTPAPHEVDWDEVAAVLDDAYRTSRSFLA